MRIDAADLSTNFIWAIYCRNSLMWARKPRPEMTTRACCQLPEAFLTSFVLLCLILGDIYRFQVTTQSDNLSPRDQCQILDWSSSETRQVDESIVVLVAASFRKKWLLLFH